MIDHHLNKGESEEVFDPIEKEGINDCYQIEEADEIVELVGHGDEEVLPLGELKDIGDGQQKGEDDDPGDHQPFDIF
jgi:hypothetical protein